MADPETPFSSSNPLVQRLLAGTAPEPIKLAAAKGALPITPEEQFHVLAALAADPLPAIQEALPATVAGLADEALAELLRHRNLPPALLHCYAAWALAKPLAIAAIVTNRATGDDTLDLIAARGGPDAIELIVTNQVRLIRAPRLIDTVVANPSTTADQRRRVLELREEFFLKKEREEKRKRDEEERLARLREKRDWSLSELEKLQDDLAKEAHNDLVSGALPSDAEGEADDDSDSEEAMKGAYQRILEMTVPEKILLAIRGSRTERNLLIKDSNRLVATSVIKCPKLNDKDIEFYASLRNVSDEILRYIGNRREWLKTYSIVHTLVKNPRTPLAVSINLLQRLQARDLKNLEGDRNVSESLRRQAKQILDRATKQGAR